MATLLLLGSLILSRYTFNRKRALARSRRGETLPAKLFERLFELSASLSIVLLFYNGLLVLLASGWKWVTAQDLERLEHALTVAQQFSDRYKPSWGMYLGVLFALYLLGHLWVRFLERDTPFRVFKKFKSVLHIVNTILFLLASFTLLGSEQGKAAATLEIHLRHERQEYGVLRREVGSALKNAAISRLYDRATNSLPQGAAIADLITNFNNDGAKLQNAYADARTKYGFRDTEISRLVKTTEAREAVFDRIGSMPTARADREAPADESPLPPTLTYDTLSKSEDRLKSVKDRFRPEFIRLLNKPGGKEIALELPDGPIDRLAEVFDPIAETYPLLKPVFDIIKSTISDAVEIAWKRKIDDLTESVVEHPDRLETLVPEAAAQVSDAAPVVATPENTQQFRRDLDYSQRQLSEIRKSTDRLERLASTAEARRSEVPRPRPSPRRRPNVTEADRDAPRSADLPDPLRTDRTAEPFRFSQPRTFDPPTFGSNPPSFGGGSTVSCTCTTYVNGVPTGSYPIPLGASCGGQICR